MVLSEFSYSSTSAIPRKEEEASRTSLKKLTALSLKLLWVLMLCLRKRDKKALMHVIPILYLFAQSAAYFPPLFDSW